MQYLLDTNIIAELQISSTLTDCSLRIGLNKGDRLEVRSPLPHRRQRNGKAIDPMRPISNLTEALRIVRACGCAVKMLTIAD